MPQKIIIDNIPIFPITKEHQNSFFELDGDGDHWIYDYPVKFIKQLLPEDWRGKEHRFNALEEEFYLIGMEIVSNEGLGARMCIDIFLEFGMILDRTIHLKEYAIYKFQHLLMQDGAGTEVSIKIV